MTDESYLDLDYILRHSSIYLDLDFINFA